MNLLTGRVHQLLYITHFYKLLQINKAPNTKSEENMSKLNIKHSTG